MEPISLGLGLLAKKILAKKVIVAVAAGAAGGAVAATAARRSTDRANRESSEDYARRLAYDHDYSPSQIADKLGVSRGDVLYLLENNRSYGRY